MTVSPLLAGLAKKTADRKKWSVRFTASQDALLAKLNDRTAVSATATEGHRPTVMTSRLPQHEWTPER